MSCFPLRHRPKESYRESPRSFGCARGGRLHAACDLYAPPGSEVLAIEDGTVLGNGYLFYAGVFALEVRHPKNA